MAEGRRNVPKVPFFLSCTRYHNEQKVTGPALLSAFPETIRRELSSWEKSFVLDAWRENGRERDYPIYTGLQSVHRVSVGVGREAW